MPLGNSIAELGMLIDGDDKLVFRPDRGGRWVLDASGAARRLVGQRVSVEGVRGGFDLLVVDRIWKDGSPRPRFGQLRIAYLAASVLVGLSLALIVSGVFA